MAMFYSSVWPNFVPVIGHVIKDKYISPEYNIIFGRKLREGGILCFFISNMLDSVWHIDMFLYGYDGEPHSYGGMGLFYVVVVVSF